MKTVLLSFVGILFLSISGQSQNWLPVAEVYHQGVLALFLDSIENDVYIGGDFRYINDLDAKGIVKWDGQTFSTLGEFPNDCNNRLQLYTSTFYY
ncbi:MAG: hypothetical protein IPJ00_20655 [Saprospirales bacterium]|nr:hypothetical protein [Saprospirales bacterium]